MKDEEMNKMIGAWLAEKRNERGMSQQDAADLLGVSKSAVHYWETGKRSIYATNLVQYCKVIGADLDEFSALIKGRK